MFKKHKMVQVWVVLATIFNLTVVPVSVASPINQISTVSSPSRVWLMSPEDDERCRQDTERYNAAWRAAWYASHPGQGPAPTPSPPYVCPPPPPDNTPTPVTPTPVTPNKPIVPVTNQGTGLPNELDNKPGNTPELNTGLGKPGQYKPGYDPATGLPVNGAEQANPNTGDPNDPQTGELARWAAANNTSPPQVNNGKPIVPANVGPDTPKPAPSKPEIIPDKPQPDTGSPQNIDKVIGSKDNPLFQKHNTSGGDEPNDYGNDTVPGNETPKAPKDYRKQNEFRGCYDPRMTAEQKDVCNENINGLDTALAAAWARRYHLIYDYLKHWIEGSGETKKMLDSEIDKLAAECYMQHYISDTIIGAISTAARNALLNPKLYDTPQHINQTDWNRMPGTGKEKGTNKQGLDVKYSLGHFWAKISDIVVTVSKPDINGKQSFKISYELNIIDFFMFEKAENAANAGFVGNKANALGNNAEIFTLGKDYMITGNKNFEMNITTNALQNLDNTARTDFANSLDEVLGKSFTNRCTV